MKKPAIPITVLALLILSIIVFGGNASASTYVAGNITGSQTWTSQNNTYYLSGNVVINSGNTLTIQPGTMVHLNGYQIQVYGTLSAQGQNSNKIYFFSDSNSNSQIYFGSSSTSSCILDNVVVYAGHVLIGGGNVRIINSYFSGGSTTCITVSGGNPQISGNTINGGNPQHCITINQASATISSNTLAGAHYGINNLGGSVTVSENTITNCFSGIFSSGQATIERNIIVYNTNDAIVTSNSLNNEIHNNALAYNTVGISGNANMQNNNIVNNQYGLWGQTSASTIQYNNIYDNNENVHLTENQIDVNAFNNWWGTDNNETIYSRISDIHIHDNLGALFYEPYLTAPATALAVPQSVEVPIPPPTPTIEPSTTATPTPTQTPTPNVTTTPYPYDSPTPTPYPYQTYWPTPTLVYFNTPTPTAIEFGGFSSGDLTNVTVILLAIALSVAIIFVINRKFTGSHKSAQQQYSAPLPPPPPP